MTSRPSVPAPTTSLVRGMTLAFAIALVLVVSVLPAGEGALRPFRWCMLCSQRAALSGFALNVVLYVPLAAALRARSSSGWLPVVACLALSGGVELAQIQIPGRFSVLEDLVANTLGGIVGSLAQPRAARWIFARGRLAHGIAAGWSLVMAAAVAAPLILLVPVVPPGPLFGQRMPALGGRMPYDGAVLEARLDDIDIPNGEVDRSRQLAERMAGPYRLRLVFTVGSRPEYPAPLLRMVGEEALAFPEVFMLGADGSDLVFRVRYRADRVKLDRPEFRAPGALDGRSPGDTVSVTVIGDRSGPLGIELDGGGGRPLAVPAARGWSAILYPGGLAERTLTLLDLAWLALLAAPLGWWAPTTRAALALAVLPALAVVAVSLSGPLVAYGATQVAALVGGGLGGALLRSLAGR